MSLVSTFQLAVCFFSSLRWCDRTPKVEGFCAALLTANLLQHEALWKKVDPEAADVLHGFTSLTTWKQLRCCLGLLLWQLEAAEVLHGCTSLAPWSSWCGAWVYFSGNLKQADVLHGFTSLTTWSSWCGAWVYLVDNLKQLKSSIGLRLWQPLLSCLCFPKYFRVTQNLAQQWWPGNLWYLGK